jgi:hypothetical protein
MKPYACKPLELHISFKSVMFYLKVVIALQVFARFQKAGVQLHWLRTWIALDPEEDMTL